MERIKRALNDATVQRQQFQKNPHARQPDKATNPESELGRSGIRTALGWIVFGAVLATSAAFLGQSWFVDPADTAGMSALGVDVEEDTAGLARLLITRSATTGLQEDIALLIGRLDDLTYSVARLEEKLRRVHEAATSIVAVSDSEPADTKPATQASVTETSDSAINEAAVDKLDVVGANATRAQRETKRADAEPATVSDMPAASGKADTEVLTSNDMLLESTAVAINDPDVIESQDVTSHKQSSTKAADKGPWVINLASLPNKTNAESYASEVQSMGIPVELYRATAKGREFWRIQVVDFTTAENARSYADSLKDKLGLKDVWITKR